MNIVLKLLGCNVKVDLKYEEVMVLVVVCFFGYMDVVKELLSLNVDVN